MILAALIVLAAPMKVAPDAPLNLAPSKAAYCLTYLTELQKIRADVVDVGRRMHNRVLSKDDDVRVLDGKLARLSAYIVRRRIDDATLDAGAVTYHRALAEHDRIMKLACGEGTSVTSECIMRTNEETKNTPFMHSREECFDLK